MPVREPAPIRRHYLKSVHYPANGVQIPAMTARATISAVRNQANTFPAMTRVLVMLIVVAVAL
jgi:hypothetical protein